MHANLQQFFFYCCHIYWQQVLTCSDSFTCSRGLPSTNFTLCWQLYLQQRFTFNQFYLVWTALPAADVDLQPVYFCIDTFTCSRGLLSTSFTLCWQLYLQQRLTYNQFYLVLTALPAAEVHLAGYGAAQTLPADRVPSDGSLHMSDTHLRLQAPLVWCAGWGTAGSSGGSACGEKCYYQNFLLSFLACLRVWGNFFF